MQSTIDFEARKLFEAIKYQIHVAIDYCHKLDDDQSLWIEVYGDIAISEGDAIEVKMWEDDLSDSHTNFWNTLSNWLKPGFDQARFKELILFTTQSFGSRSRLREWNQSDPSKRLDLLASIGKNRRIGRSTGVSLAEDYEPLKSRSAAQRKMILGDEMRDSLLAVIPKIKIVPEQQNLSELIASYKRQMLGGINPNRKDDYVNDLFGFMMDVNLINGGWEIKGREFNAKLQQLTQRHMVGPVKFPILEAEKISIQAAELDLKGRRFARKLIEIDAEQYVAPATLNMLEAHEHISEMIRDCAVSHEDIVRYQAQLYEVAFWSREMALEELDSQADRSTRNRASRKYFQQTCAGTVTPLCSFQDTPVSFRNGIYHLLADEEPGIRSKEFHWRLWDE